MAEVSLGPVARFARGTLTRIEIGLHPLAVALDKEGAFHIIDDLCTHANARLSDGWLEEGCVACPWHGAQFDLQTGQALSLPATGQVKTYPVVIREDHLFTEMDSDLSSNPE